MMHLVKFSDINRKQLIGQHYRPIRMKSNDDDEDHFLALPDLLMEEKLAEFRRRQSERDGVPLLVRLRSILPTKNGKRAEQEEEEEEPEESPPTTTSWSILVLKVLIWLTLFGIFLRLEFGAVYFIFSLFYLIWTNLGRRRRRSNELSAYSVFNRNFVKVQGTFSAEDYDRQLRRGGTPLFSSSSSS